MVYMLGPTLRMGGRERVSGLREHIGNIQVQAVEGFAREKSRSTHTASPLSPSMSSDTGVRRMSPVNSHVVFWESIPEVPSNTCELGITAE